MKNYHHATISEIFGDMKRFHQIVDEALQAANESHSTDMTFGYFFDTFVDYLQTIASERVIKMVLKADMQSRGIMVPSSPATPPDVDDISSELIYFSSLDLTKRIISEIHGENFVEADQIFQTALSFFQAVNPEVERKEIAKYLFECYPDPKPNNFDAIFDLQNLAEKQRLKNTLSKNLSSKSGSHNRNKRAKI